ncbi:MAG: hypothetical protein EBZ87_00435 [Microbacteriaceae bacterium]|nr:hypothetical protein [Microbacteriaceae bacterium]
MGELTVPGIPQETDGRFYRMTITILALDAPDDPEYDPTPLIEVSRIGAEVIGWQVEELFLMEPVCPDCAEDASARDAVLQAMDAIVQQELGEGWSLEAHMERKAALLRIVDGEER